MLLTNGRILCGYCLYISAVSQSFGPLAIRTM